MRGGQSRAEIGNQGERERERDEKKERQRETANSRKEETFDLKTKQILTENVSACVKNSEMNKLNNKTET